MRKSELIVIGAGGHSRSCIDTIEQEGKYKIAGLVGLGQEVGSSQFGYIGFFKNLVPHLEVPGEMSL